MNEAITILAIESSCDETSAAVLQNRSVLSNLIAGQEIHASYGGVVPELASREHQKNIVPVVDMAIKKAGILKSDIDAIAYTSGPGLMGSLLVGTSFAKGLSIGLGIPLIEVHHMKAHVLAHFIEDEAQSEVPNFPFLCLTVSGGHTQIVKVTSPSDFEVLGETRDDAAGEAFDKVAKILGLPYPGGPLIDKHAQLGNPNRFTFPKASIEGFDMSFSGLKTAVLYFLRDALAENPQFIEENLNDVCASVQRNIVESLLSKLAKAADEHQINHLALAGGVSANSELRESFSMLCEQSNRKAFIPKFEYCTDNAAMIGIAGYFKYLDASFSSLNELPKARLSL